MPLSVLCRYCPRSAVCFADGNWPYQIRMVWPINAYGPTQDVECNAGTKLSGAPLPAVQFKAPWEKLDEAAM